MNGPRSDGSSFVTKASGVSGQPEGKTGQPDRASCPASPDGFSRSSAHGTTSKGSEEELGRGPLAVSEQHQRPPADLDGTQNQGVNVHLDGAATPIATGCVVLTP